MDRRKVVLRILDSYEEITITDQQDDFVFFEIGGKEYIFWYPERDQDTSSPVIFVKNDSSYDYPHILPTGIPLDKKFENKYRYICLDENDSVIHFLQTFEEKIKDSIEKLIHLISLSKFEREEEFQKEFLFYWNQVAENIGNCSLYIGTEREFQKLNAYINNDGEFRFVASGICLNDANMKVNGRKKWNHLSQLPVFYIPITDKRRVLPPTRDKKWNAENIIMIINGKQFNRISHESYVKLEREKVKTKYIGLVFDIEINGNYIDFAAIIKFRSAKNDTLFNKLKQEIVDVVPIVSRRKDYYYLCKQIGNDTTLLDKKVLLIGAGSLGSYVARELVKIGVRRLTIYDKERLEEENLLRHTMDGWGVNHSKVLGLKCELERIHPEIHINAIEKDIDKNSPVEEEKNADVIIWTVGSSDIQWEMNRTLKEQKCNARVIYTWLEAGGENSHILSIDYNKQGCFQCLFTDNKGDLINNKANNVSEIDVNALKIRNGCGGTRVAYGNAVLLRTTAVLLDVIKKNFDKAEYANNLINITPTAVIDVKDTFVEGKCGCCGDGDI